MKNEQDDFEKKFWKEQNDITFQGYIVVPIVLIVIFGAAALLVNFDKLGPMLLALIASVIIGLFMIWVGFVFLASAVRHIWITISILIPFVAVGMFAFSFTPTEFFCKKPYTQLSLRWAAKNGDADAQWELGTSYLQRYDNGIFREDLDGDRAEYWLKKSASQGHIKGQYVLGYIYLNGDEYGIKQNYAEAKRLFEIAAKAGNITANSNLGEMYIKGLGVERDFNRGISLYRLSAEAGSKGAQEYLYQYYSGLGKKPDEAAYWKAQYDKPKK